MTKIIALSCTQKKTRTLTDELLDCAVKGFKDQDPEAQIEPIRLIDYNIELCQGEDTCLQNGGFCPLRDDFNTIVQKAKGAKGMILVTPTYGGNVPAILKITQERLKQYMNSDTRPFGGMSVANIVHARAMLPEYALSALATWYGRLQNKSVINLTFTQAGHPDITQTHILQMSNMAGKQLATIMQKPAPNIIKTHNTERPECG